MGYSKLADIIRGLNLVNTNKLLTESYYNEGYNGLFGKQAQFIYHNNKIELQAPEYTRYMIYGSRGKKTGLPNRKFPPYEPIADWCVRYGITKDVNEVRAKVYWYGTEGNDFISKNFPKYIQAVELDIVNPLTHGILNSLRDMWKGTNISKK